MKTLLSCVVAALALVSGLRSHAAVPTNLLVNGSFEEGPEVDQFKSLDEDATAIKGWIVTRGQIDYVGTHWKAADGNRSLDLHGSPGFGAGPAKGPSTMRVWISSVVSLASATKSQVLVTQPGSSRGLQRSF